MVQSRAGTPGTVGLVVRMPEDLRDRIKAAAEANGRSQNSEIVTTLEREYPPPDPSADLLSELLAYLRGATSVQEFRERAAMVNLRLAESGDANHWQIEIPDEKEGEIPKTIRLLTR